MIEEASKYKLVLDTLTAVGTVGATWAAIWGDRVRRRLFAPSLQVALLDDKGEFTKDGAGNPLLIFHLRIKNNKPDHPAEDCEAHLIEIWRGNLNDAFERVVMVTPRRLLWAPRELNPPAITIYEEAILDFGLLQSRSLIAGQTNCFVPWLENFPNNFSGYVSSNETMRFVIQVRARNLARPVLATFEVYWDGHWAADAEKMREHVIIHRLGATQVTG